MKRIGFGLGPTGPTPEELEKEAAAELRRAMAGSGPRPQFQGRGMPSDWLAEEQDVADDGGPGWRSGLTREDERRAVTDLAVQQLTDRPFGTIRPEDTLSVPAALTDAEDIRNRALAEFLERQQRMSKEQPAASPGPRVNRLGEPMVQRTSGVTISPRLTVAPTLTGNRGRLPEIGPGHDRLHAPSRAAPVGRAAPMDAGDGLSPALRQTIGQRRGQEPNDLATQDPEDNGATATGGGRDVWTRPVKPRRGAPGVAGVTARVAEQVAEPRERDTPMKAPRNTPAGLSASAGGASPAIRSRPVQRRAGARAATSIVEPEMHWRVLAELADLLAEEVFPGDALPALCRWLAATTGTTAAILLLTDDAIDDVVAWPPDEPLAVDLAGLVGQPLDERSTICTSVRDGRTISGPPDDAPTMPGGGSVHDVGGWAAVPIIDRTVAFGAIFIAGPHNEAVGDATVHLLEEVAQRVARALFNCEEAASSAATGGNGLPAALRDRLGALSFVLGGIQASTGLLLAPEDERKYTDIAQQAVTLHARIDDFLTGRGGASE